MNKNRKHQMVGLLGALIVHVFLFLLLWLVFIRATEKTGESGVPVVLGADMQSQDGGAYELTDVDILTEPKGVTAPIETAEASEIPELITQEDEESVVLDSQKKEQKVVEKTEKQRNEIKKVVAEQKQNQPTAEELEVEKRLAEERAAAERAAKSVAGAFGKGSTMEKSRGNADSGIGNQGSSTGNSDTGKYSGEGGYGSFDLNGRSLGKSGLPKPQYDVQVEGKVVVTIRVNPEGKVIATSINRGTNTANPTLRKAAEEAARKARFNAISGNQTQDGTITYYFKLK